MKILEINKFYFVKGGAEKHFFDVIDLLETYDNEVAVFSMEHSNNRDSKWSKYFLSTVGYTSEYSLGQKIRGVARMFYSFEAKNKINAILDDFQPDVVHIHNIYHQLSPSILFEIKKRNIPIIMTVHDYKLINPNYNLYHDGKMYERCKSGKYYQCLIDRCIKNSYVQSFVGMLESYWHNFLGTYKKNIDTYIVPSKFVQKVLVNRGVDEKKITVLPHFLSKEYEQCENKSLQNSGSEKYALSMGRMTEGKNVEGIVNIFKDTDNIKLYIAGNVDEGKSDNSEKVIYLNWLNAEALKGYITNAQFVISSSRLPETFGLIALESISQGIPFVGFKTGAYSEIIQNGNNGILVDDELQMGEVVRQFSDGEISFDHNNIRESALSKYNKNIYYEKLIKVFKEQ